MLGRVKDIPKRLIKENEKLIAGYKVIDVESQEGEQSEKKEFVKVENSDEMNDEKYGCVNGVF